MIRLIFKKQEDIPSVAAILKVSVVNFLEWIFLRVKWLRSRSLRLEGWLSGYPGCSSRELEFRSQHPCLQPTATCHPNCSSSKVSDL